VDLCDYPKPVGWYCTRERNHAGPCAAWPVGVSLVKRFMLFMSHFWWHTACPQPDGKFNCRLKGKPYAWTGRLHTPWYLWTHPERRARYNYLTTKRLVWRAVLSLLLIPAGLVIWLGRGRHAFFRSNCRACNHVGPLPAPPEHTPTKAYIDQQKEVSHLDLFDALWKAERWMTEHGCSHEYAVLRKTRSALAWHSSYCCKNVPELE
jgi:hypothetical protein